MSNSMDVNTIMGLESDHYGKGLYHFSVNKAEIIETKTNRMGINLTLQIVDTEVLKGDRQPLGEKMFKTFYFPTPLDRPSSAEFMGRLVQEFLKAVDVKSHPEYSTVSAGGIDAQAFWDLTLGAEFTAQVDWTEKTQKVTDDNGKTTYEGTGENEQTIKKFKKLA